MNWMNQFNNLNGNYIKKVMFDLIKEKYYKNEQIIDRLGTMLANDNDMKSFFTLVTDVYETAYMKSVQDHKEQLTQLGLTATIVAEKTRT